MMKWKKINFEKDELRNREFLRVEIIMTLSRELYEFQKL